ncbi:MAG: hypothetical protein ACYCU3_12060 [Streptosporangiaceae bacterium]
MGLIPGNRIIIGASLGFYPKLLADAPGATGLRMYADQENDSWRDGRRLIQARG